MILLHFILFKDEIGNNYDLSHLIPKFEPKYDTRSNSDPNFVDVEG